MTRRTTAMAAGRHHEGCDHAPKAKTNSSRAFTGEAAILDGFNGSSIAGPCGRSARARGCDGCEQSPGRYAARGWFNRGGGGGGGGGGGDKKRQKLSVREKVRPVPAPLVVDLDELKGLAETLGNLAALMADAYRDDFDRLRSGSMRARRAAATNCGWATSARSSARTCAGAHERAHHPQHREEQRGEAEAQRVRPRPRCAAGADAGHQPGRGLRPRGRVRRGLEVPEPQDAPPLGGGPGRAPEHLRAPEPVGLRRADQVLGQPRRGAAAGAARPPPARLLPVLHRDRAAADGRQGRVPGGREAANRQGGSLGCAARTRTSKRVRPACAGQRRCGRATRTSLGCGRRTQWE